MPAPADNARLLRLRVAFKLILAIGAVAMLAVILDYLGGGARPTGTVERFAVADVDAGEARRLDWEGRPVIVVRREAGGWFVAIASGTAAGCPLSWEPAQRTFLEACSGTRYDSDGRPLDAPDLAPLTIPPHHFDDAGRLVLGQD